MSDIQNLANAYYKACQERENWKERAEQAEAEVDYVRYEVDYVRQHLAVAQAEVERLREHVEATQNLWQQDVTALEAEVERVSSAYARAEHSAEDAVERAEQAEAVIASIYAEGLVPVLEKRAEKAEAEVERLHDELGPYESVAEAVEEAVRRAEAELERLKHGVLRDDEPTRCTAGHIRMMNQEWEDERALADELAEAIQIVRNNHGPLDPLLGVALNKWKEARQ